MSPEPRGVGSSLRRSPAVAWAALAFGVAVMAADLLLVANHYTYRIRTWTAGLASMAGVLLVLGALARFDRPTLGLRLSPIQGWGYWAKVALVAGIGFGVLLLAVFGIGYLLGFDLGPAPRFQPAEVRALLVPACVEAPLFEETVYRLALCTGAVAVLRTWPTVGMSGLAFGLLHFGYGSPAPDNVLAGYLLAWVYLQSGTILLPIVLHALGNLTVLLLGLGFYTWG